MAAVDYFLKFSTIKGESSDSKHKDEIEVESWSWGATNDAPRAGAGAEAPEGPAAGLPFRDAPEQSDPVALKACATGEHIKKATLTVRKAGKGQQEYLIFKFHDLLISSYQTAGTEEHGNPNDSVAFNFSKMEMEYKAQKPDGTLAPGEHFKYDLKAKRSSSGHATGARSRRSPARAAGPAPR